jgi:biopolymer transport protein ExbD
MAKVKVKKQSTFIDMTAMSDVTVLLLTFFMLTSTFLDKEPISVTAPASVSEYKIPESNKLTILVNPEGKVFMSLDNKNDLEQLLASVGEDYGMTFTANQATSFRSAAMFGVPISSLAAFLDSSSDQQDKILADVANTRVGIPNANEGLSDERGAISSDNEFKHWVSHARRINPDLVLTIKADRATEYPIIKKVIDDLRDLRENRYLLITSLRTASSQ